MNYLKLLALFVVLAIVQTIVSNLLGLNEIMKQGKLGELGGLVYNITFILSGALIALTIQNLNTEHRTETPNERCLKCLFCCS